MKACACALSNILNTDVKHNFTSVKNSLLSLGMFGDWSNPHHIIKHQADKDFFDSLTDTGLFNLVAISVDTKNSHALASYALKARLNRKGLVAFIDRIVGDREVKELQNLKDRILQHQGKYLIALDSLQGTTTTVDSVTDNNEYSIRKHGKSHAFYRNGKRVPHKEVPSDILESLVNDFYNKVA